MTGVFQRKLGHRDTEGRSCEDSKKNMTQDYPVDILIWIFSLQKCGGGLKKFLFF